MIAPAPPMLTSTSGPITDAEKRKYEEERAKLYQQLDEKDDEIQRISQEGESMRQQVLHNVHNDVFFVRFFYWKKAWKLCAETKR